MNTIWALVFYENDKDPGTIVAVFDTFENAKGYVSPTDASTLLMSMPGCMLIPEEYEVYGARHGKLVPRKFTQGTPLGPRFLLQEANDDTNRGVPSEDVGPAESPADQ